MFCDSSSTFVDIFMLGCEQVDVSCIYKLQVMNILLPTWIKEHSKLHR
jgi:hypothetical protein